MLPTGQATVTSAFQASARSISNEREHSPSRRRFRSKKDNELKLRSQCLRCKVNHGAHFAF